MQGTHTKDGGGGAAALRTGGASADPRAWLAGPRSSFTLYAPAAFLCLPAFSSAPHPSPTEGPGAAAATRPQQRVRPASQPASMGNRQSLEDHLVNLRLASKQMVRASKKAESSEKEAKNKLKKAIEAHNTEGARIYAQVRPCVRPSGTRLQQPRGTGLGVCCKHTAAPHPSAHAHTAGLPCLSTERHPGEEPGPQLPAPVVQNRCGRSTARERHTHEAGEPCVGREGAGTRPEVLAPLLVPARQMSAARALADSINPRRGFRAWHR